MIYSTTQNALREMRTLYSKPITFALICAVALILGISGPFGTLDAMLFGPRLVYWAITVPVTFTVGSFCSVFMIELLGTKRSKWVVNACAALSAAVCVAATVVVLNWIAFNEVPMRPEDVTQLLIPVMFISVVVASAFLMLSNYSIKPLEDGEDMRPLLLDRLDLDKRGSLISMSVQDHYVEITTSAGTSLLLMRLSDAMRETSARDVLQVQRSHWVARDQVSAVQRKGDKALLTLSDGRIIPASRRYINALKDAGLLAR